MRRSRPRVVSLAGVWLIEKLGHREREGGMGGGWVARLSQGGGGVVQPAYRHIGKKTAPDAQRTQRAICFAGHRGLPEWLWD